MQIQQANYYKIIGRDTNSLQANTRRAPHDLIMLVIIDPWGEGRGRREPPPPPPPTTPFLFFSLLKVNFPLRLPPFAVQIPLPLPSSPSILSLRCDTIVEDRNEHRLRQSETSFVV